MKVKNMAEVDEQSSGEELDRVLDAALAKYAAVEPRTGLEERVLANLRSAAPSANGTWWRWSFAAAAAAVLLIALTLAWRSHARIQLRITRFDRTPQSRTRKRRSAA